MGRQIEIRIEHEDIREVSCDVVVLKHARLFHGASQAVAKAMTRSGVPLSELEPGLFEHRLKPSGGVLGSTHSLFVGVQRLRDFGYPEMRGFARTALGILARELPATRHLALTIHGPGYGLDEVEGLVSLTRGVLDALEAGEFPEGLERVTFVEFNARRVERLRLAFDSFVKEQTGARRDGHRFLFELESETEKPDSPEVVSPSKPHIFVAMPFSPEMEDVFYYGIQGPVHQAGFLCERVDKSVFQGDIVGRILEKIRSSAAVVADLTGANPNVYLEVGYAWGLGRPAILITKNIDGLRFDVRGHRCLQYRNIKELERSLSLELAALKEGRLETNS